MMKLRCALLIGLMIFSGISAKSGFMVQSSAVNVDVAEYSDQDLLLVKTPGSLLLRALHLYNQNDDTVKKQVQNLIADADKILPKSPKSVMDKTYVPPSRDKHDYVSMAPYWWPNPETENGLPYIRKDGEVNPEARDGTFDKVRFSQTCSDIHTLALAYWFTEDVRYRKKAIELTEVWFINESTRMNPHLRYGQFVPGSNEGRQYGIIETNSLFGIIDAVNLMRNHEPLEKRFETELINWIQEYKTWLLTHELGIKEGKARNNHGTWYGAQVSAFGLFADREAEAAKYIQTECMARLSKHVEPDGSQPEELARTKTLNYSLMNLRGHLMVACMAEPLGIDLFNFEDNPLKLALEYILNHLPPRGEWRHKQISDISPSQYNELAKMITNYNQNPLTKDKIEGVSQLNIDLTDWNWLLYGGKPE